MKALTLYQPWATLIAYGQKRVETRPRPWKYEGPIAIHAGKTIDAAACEQFKFVPQALPTGCVVAIAEMIGCVEFPSLQYPPEPYGDYTPGRYGYPFRRIQALDTPIAARGKQGIWEFDEALLPEDVAKLVRLWKLEVGMFKNYV